MESDLHEGSGTHVEKTVSDGRTAVIVLGMHRSGTSALTRTLGLLGLTMPQYMLGANDSNASGHWEPERLVALHDTMLLEGHSRWDDWRRFDPQVLGPERLSFYRSRMKDILSDEYGDADLIVLKDPRICRFAPMYEEVLSEMGMDTRFVITYRDPLSVAASLEGRDGMGRAHAVLLWLRYVLDAESSTRNHRRVIVSYDEYLQNWRSGVEKIRADLDLEWPEDPGDVSDRIDEYLSPDLRHHRFTPKDIESDEQIGPEVLEVHEAMLGLIRNAEDRESMATLSRVSEEIASGDVGLGTDDWRDLAEEVFDDMARRQGMGQRNRDHLKRLIAGRRDAVTRLSEQKDKLQESFDEVQVEVSSLGEALSRVEAENADLENRLASARAQIATHKLSASQHSEEKSALEQQIVKLREDVAAQAAEAGRLGAERNQYRTLHERSEKERETERIAHARELEESRKEETRLKRVQNKLKAEQTRLKRRSSRLNSELSQSQEEADFYRNRVRELREAIESVQDSSSWKLSMPVRLMKQLTSDPKNALRNARAPILSEDVEAPTAEAPSRPKREALPQGHNRRPDRAAAESAGEGRKAEVQEKENGRAAPVEEPIVESGPDIPEVQPRTEKTSLPEPQIERMDTEELARARAYFDADYYLDTYPDIATGDVDPFDHFMKYGWREGRDPSPSFSTSYYQQRYPQIANAGVNPYVHWVRHGKREKRSTVPFQRRLELMEYRPRVSAIVPNYNHARFLEQRIESILAQTYDNVEILVLDDCSTDSSREVVERYCELHPERVRSLFNDENSGNVFRQWRKGMENSAGDLVWICESDDFCEPDFLEGLVTKFRDRSVNIAFGRIQFADSEGDFQEGLDQYREGAEPGIWDVPLTRPAQRWFAGAFGVNNVIANVGGCVFRRQSLPEDVWNEAEEYSILGDWFLYTHLAGGGQISYEPSSVAYFRQHGANTSVSSFVTPGYYTEHERLMLLLRRRWGVPEETVEAFYQKVAFQYTRHNLEDKLGPMSKYCDKQKILEQEREEKHILMAFMGFFLGGGEVFPIHLSNTLREHGYIVSMMALDMGEVKQEMLDSLDTAIPVYESSWVKEYGADHFLSDAGISVIHSHMISLEVFFFEECRIETKIPYLVTLHGSYESTNLTRERLTRILFGVSHFVYIADKNLEPFRVLPLSDSLFTKLRNSRPVDPRPFPQTRKELGVPEDAIVFTLVARGIQRKGWRATLRAFCNLRDSAPKQPVHLLLCGEGVETDRYSAQYGDAPGITFLGYQSCIHGLYRMSDVALVPTRFAGESFPLCIIEALQTGTPVISTKVGEIETMLRVDEKRVAGILLEYQRDTEEFTAALQKSMAAMLRDPKRMEYSEIAWNRGLTYDMDEVTGEYTSLYEIL